MPLVNRLIEEECLSQKRRKDSTLTYSSHGSFPSTPATADFEEGIPIDDTYELVKVAKQRSQRVIKSVDIEEYPRILVSHFFAINEYTSYPRVLDFTEYSTTFRNQHPPDYLISAIIADSSLVSPSIHLHRQNLEFFEHHYQLSLTQMLPYLAKPNIILIQAILILWESDHNMGNFTRCIERMTSAIRLSQTLNFHHISDPSSRLYQIYNKQQLNTIRKLWDLMHFRDHQIAQLVNRPSLLPPYEKELRDYNLGNPIIKHQELLGQSKHSFPNVWNKLPSIDSRMYPIA
ncbi:hypothetical protein CONCODRAFT_78964 [Conidiobolus coronatus NRRL 28638]|uniref:Transcription factor domain-containing protein n=1 Tax=Conidiobolus coronatus (strain ATCC 28846 / CBS 209.66 / NRRL 28638) TaxID=796925 RepID=A0A137P5C1_CONC2|nr:hypothetical protein CONCODRAFT_78964 [Conidiobolus coronatus NRRL 28638]|eukprot:KXN70205.1 hypothetical protein CONCODRAFT_78964 [Conidiobolus coronatus NRRL 28638]